jgi:D-amino-acid dehydrogenase
MRVLVMGAGVVGVTAAWQLLEVTPEGTPALGRGRLANLWYNTGHGHMGWTMACGTARLCADLIAGRTPDLPLEGLTLR